MKKGIVFLCVFAAAIIVLAGVSSAVVSVDPEYKMNHDKILVEMNRYRRNGKDTVLTELNNEEVAYLKTCLIKLNDALERDDEVEILKYEKILNDKGILGDTYQKIRSDSLSSRLLHFSRLRPLPLDDTLSNSLCYVHATGEGIMIFTIGIILTELLYSILSNASSFLEALVLGLVLLPFYVLVFLATHLIPFRILLPIGTIGVENGTISTIGLDGFHTSEITGNMTKLDVYGFTGITISLPGTNQSKEFLFVSGFSFMAKEL